MTEQHYYYLQPNPVWLTAFNVSEDEIKINRAGQVSRMQRRRLWIDRLPPILGCILLWLATGFVYTVFRNQATAAPSTQCLSGLLFLSLFMAIAVMVRAWLIMANLKVSVATGVAKLEERTDRYGGLFLHLDGRNFELKRPQFNLLHDGMTLAVYYAQHRKRVLAIEPIVFHEPE